MADLSSADCLGEFAIHNSQVYRFVFGLTGLADSLATAITAALLATSTASLCRQ